MFIWLKTLISDDQWISQSPQISNLVRLMTLSKLTVLEIVTILFFAAINEQNLGDKDKFTTI